MSKFSIKDLEHLSGIKAHTIRIWEQRYELLHPERTDTNIRYYGDQDLKLVLNVALLKDHGHKISKIANMSLQDMQEEVVRITQTNLGFEDQIHALTLCTVEMDEAGFDKLLSTSIVKMGFEKTVINVIFPFLRQVGILWQTGAIIPAQEHFISNLIRQKLIIAIENQHVHPERNAKKYILYLPEGELHELSLLFTDYVVRSRNNKSIYLGQGLPLPDLESAYEIYKPDYLFTVITCFPSSTDVQTYVNQIAARFPDVTIILTGMQIVGQAIDIPSNVVVMNSVPDMISFVESNSEPAGSQIFLN
ncbi:MAG: MerR family transcriptional regulator [Cyclobacteriaceae bacterium]